MDILEFISKEHNNELVSLANLKGELGYLHELDEIYREVRRAFSIDAKNDLHYAVSLMYLQAHNEFYIGMSQYFRSHLHKALISVRIAIEASFNAYYLTKNPGDARDYLYETTEVYKKVCKYIKTYIKTNIKDYPLAQDLVGTHETTSRFSAHSAMTSIAYKYEHREKTKEAEEMILLNYFDKLEYDLFMGYYFSILMFYFKIFKLFYNCFYKDALKIDYPDRDKRISSFEEKIVSRGRFYWPKGNSIIAPEETP